MATNHIPTNDELLTKLRERFPEAVVEVPEETIDFTVVIDPDSLRDVARFLHDELGFDYLTDLTAVDLPDYFEVIYHLYGVNTGLGLWRVKVRCPDKETPALSSVVDIWKSADFQEREVYDLMGIRFDGHPNLKRIMMWEGFEGHPLRKDYENRTFTYAEMEPSRQATEDW